MPSRWPPHALRAWPVGVPIGSRWWAAALAVGGGLAGAAAFPRLGLWPLAAVSVACLSIAVQGRRARTAAWLGYLYGAAFFLPLLHWTGVFVGALPWLLLALAEAVFCAGLGAVLAIVQRLPAAPLWIGAAWVLQEAVRDRVPFGGFPWGRLAFSQADSPLRWFAALGGMPLLSFAVALAGAALAWPVLAVARRHALGEPHRRASSAASRGVAGALAVILRGTRLRRHRRPAGRRPRPHCDDRARPGQRPGHRAGLRDPGPAGARQPCGTDAAARRRDPGRDRAAARVSCSGRRTPRTSTRSPTPLPTGEIDSTVRTLWACRYWSGRSWTARAEPSAQRRHPVVADVRAWCAVHQAASGAVRRVHPAARPCRAGQLGRRTW